MTNHFKVKDLPLLLDFGPGVAEGDGAVEDGGAGLAVFLVGDEVAHAQELKPLSGLGVLQAGFEFAVGQHFE